MAAKILVGIAVAVLVGVVVGAVVFLAAPAASTGVAATVQTTLNDDGTKRIGEYLHNSFQASAEMGGVLISMELAHYIMT